MSAELSLYSVLPAESSHHQRERLYFRERENVTHEIGALVGSLYFNETDKLAVKRELGTLLSAFARSILRRRGTMLLPAV